MQVRNQIVAKLNSQFSPVFLVVEDESHLHHVPKGAQSHFKVVLVSEAFAGKTRVRRHQMVYQVLAAEFFGGMHALALQTLTAEEWREQDSQPLMSPPCRGLAK